MSNRTYRYFKGKALFPFGHGLSYTIFDYGKAKVDKQNVRAGEGMTLTIPLKNTGKLDGDEVIQVYLRNPADKEGPIKTLRAFRRVSFQPVRRKISGSNYPLRHLSVLIRLPTGWKFFPESMSCSMVELRMRKPCRNLRLQ